MMRDCDLISLKIKATVTTIVFSKFEENIDLCEVVTYELSVLKKVDGMYNKKCISN